MITLRKAINEGKIDQFIEERDGAPDGDADRLNQAVRSMAGRSSAAPKASKKANRDG